MLAQGGGRLIHYENAHVPVVDCFRNLDQLNLRQTDFPHFLARIDLEAEPLQQLSRIAIQLFPVDQAIALRQITQIKVLRDTNVANRT